MATTGRDLPVLDGPPRASAEACCDACAGAELAALGAGTAAGAVPPSQIASAQIRPVRIADVPIASPEPAARRRALDRTSDRHLTRAGVLVAVGFVAVALVAALTEAALGGTAWFPVHLVLAGAAGTAIAAVLPFFTATLAVAPPADPRVRVGAIGFVATGAAITLLSVRAGAPFLGHLGGSAYLVGLALVAIAAFAPLRSAIGVRRRSIERAYAVALVSIGVGVLIATALLAGWEPIVVRWAMLKPAHVWLNLVGSVSLIVVATLTHLAPTVEGARIEPRRSARFAIVAIAFGAPSVAIGYAFDVDTLARVGATVVLVGAVGVPVHAAAVASHHGRWTTDPGWHRMATWSLRAAAVWFLVAMLVMAGRVVWLGASPAAWSFALVGVPLVLGWLLQVLIGAWTHLLPAVGGGSPDAAATRRRWLGTAAGTRWVLLNGGIAAAWLGSVAGVTPLASLGWIAIGLAVATAIGLVVAAVIDDIRIPGARFATR